MTPDQESKCHEIIHSHAVAIAAGNAISVLGSGIATDMVTMTAMRTSLCAAFGDSTTEAVARAMVIAVIRSTMLEQPIKTMVGELSKLIPDLGNVVAPTTSVALLEAAG